MSSFIDRITLFTKGGDGGNGCVSVRREKFKPLGGPDGADGGNGGSVILEVDPSVTTLLDYHHRPHRRAENGTAGSGDLRIGKNAPDVILRVPDGTVVKNRKGEVLADLVGAGTQFIAAQGGRGGLGNASLANAKRKAPGFALLGDPGEEVDLILELKTVADVALVGFPSAGKSSLIATISAARPKIADYPFTTLVPNLGVVEAGETRFTVADVPGLIPGASEGKGLGLDFLRHIERCSVLVHVIDCATLEPGRDPISDLELIESELDAYSADLTIEGSALPLTQRPRLVALNKIDVPEAADLADFVTEELSDRGYQVFHISTASREGLRPLTFAIADLVKQARAATPEPVATSVVVKPRVANNYGFTITKRQTDHVYYLVQGDKPERWVRQTDFSNDEAVGYLADRLTTLGIEKELIRMGAVAGDEVVIGDGPSGVVFDWEPTMQTGAEHLGTRGSDRRLEDHARPTRQEKREEFRARMDAKTAAREEVQNTVYEDE